MTEAAPVVEEQKPLRIVLNPDRDKRVKAGHLWIFSNEIKEVLSDHPPLPAGRLHRSRGRAAS